jgi:hypothetical protein
MSKRMPSRRQIPLVASFVWLAASACSASSRPETPIDCNAGDAYELSAPLRVFEIADEVWFSGADPTGTRTTPVAAAPNAACSSSGGAGTGGSAAVVVAGASTGSASISVAVEPIEGGGRCGSANAMVLRSAGHNDWGSLFGDWKLASAPGTAFCDTCGPWNGSGYDGLAIWARVAEFGDKSVTVLLDTWQTSASGTSEADAALVCKVDCSSMSGTRTIDEAGNTLSQSYVSPPGTCGNGFQRVLTLTAQWQLVLLPFKSFYQDLKPNAISGAMDVAHINGLTFRTAKEANVEIWVDDIAFYKHK